MAKVKGGLFSMEASGTVGDTITFDKRGFVRTRVIPANPKSDAQGNVRQRLLAVQKALRHVGALVVAAIKTLAPTSYRWNAYIVSQIIGASGVEFAASLTAFAALSSDDKTAWETKATALGISTQGLDYASDPNITPGQVLFAIARTLYRLGLNVSAGTPIGTNSTAWGNYFAS
jgi:hypothetical protein